MDATALARAQFGITAGFHYIYPPLSIGIGTLMVIMEGIYLKTKKVIYHNMCRYWTKIFALTFAIGVASGIVLEFEFGTNWATYSRFVGDVFGGLLASEGLFAFFLESGFLAVLVFGWNKVGPKMHFFATTMVALGSTMSAFWIIAANSFMQTPTGYSIELNGKIMPPGYVLSPEQIEHARIVVNDYWAIVFNPSTIDRFLHVMFGAWLCGAFLMMSISAFYLLKGRHLNFAKKTLCIALTFAVVAAVCQMIMGDLSAREVALNQPEKLAALEGLWQTTNGAPLSIAGWVDTAQQITHSIKIPDLLSLLAYHSIHAPVRGLTSFPVNDRPNTAVVFQTYRVMVGSGIAIAVISIYGVYLWIRGKLYETRWFLWVLVFAVFLPQIANETGWMTAEMGRQPWVVYHIMRTSEAVSTSVTMPEVLTSLVLFVGIYVFLFAVFILLLSMKIKHGPSNEETAEELPENWRKHLA